MASPQAFSLDRTYVQLQDGARADLVPVGPDFWKRIEERTELHEGRLLMVSRQSAAWPHWEMHPAGDEILILMSGAFALQIERADGTVDTIEMRAGSTCVVPRYAKGEL